MSKHRSDLTETHSAYDFDVVSDPPRPFKIRHGIPADAAAALPPGEPFGKPAEAPAETPIQPATEVAK